MWRCVIQKCTFTTQLKLLLSMFIITVVWKYCDDGLVGWLVVKWRICQLLWVPTPMPESFQCHINNTKPPNSLSSGNINAPILQGGEKKGRQAQWVTVWPEACAKAEPGYPSLHSSALNQPLNHCTRKDRHKRQAPALCKQAKID